MKATCPKSKDHKQFVTVAHVAQDWVVDEYGNFEMDGERGETVHGPNAGNTWSCYVCGAEAKVED